MKIAMYYPSERDMLFCEHTGHDFVFQTCDSSVDLIYVASISRLTQALSAKNKFNIPIVCWCWDIPYNWREWEMSSQGMVENSFRDNVNKQRVNELKQCDLIITASKWVKNIIKERYRLDSVQIYSYIDVEGLDRTPSLPKQKSIIQISRFFFNKKFHHTVIAARDVDYDVNFFGTGIMNTYGKEIKNTIEQYDSQVNIYDNVSRKKILETLKQSTLLTSPSVFEGWGITPIEALYCGVPVLLSDLEVFKEVYGDNVIYHKRNDPEDMKEKLEMILSDKILQQKMVEDCKPLIKDFTPQKFAERFNKTIKLI